MSDEQVCRICGTSRITSILDLGRVPLANALLTDTEVGREEATYPLELVLCENCSLVQILETVPPEELFSEYLYLSSFSNTMLDHAQNLAQELIAERSLNENSLVIEAASNDGYLLQYYQRTEIPVLGIEPAGNVSEIAISKGIRTLPRFFNAELAAELREDEIQADVFHANNVLAHVADLNGFVEAIRILLKEDGLAVIEAPYIKDLIDHCEFDTIYHEHLCYFSLTALASLFERHGMMIQDVRRVAIHGGSLRLYVVPAKTGLSPRRTVTDLLQQEADWGVNSIEFYRNFADRVVELKQNLLQLLQQLKCEGKRIAAYGASAKGSTLMNYCGIDRRHLDYVVDRSTVKQGRFTPGTHLAIHPPQHLLEDRPDYLLLLTWNFADEIMNQQAEYRSGGGRFITPIPELKVA